LLHYKEKRNACQGKRGKTAILILAAKEAKKVKMSPVPHGHPKNDATTCGKPARNSHSTQDGQKLLTIKPANGAGFGPGCFCRS